MIQTHQLGLLKSNQVRGMAWTEEKMEATHGFKAGKWLAVCVLVCGCLE